MDEDKNATDLNEDCGAKNEINKKRLMMEEKNREDLMDEKTSNPFLYPNLDDPKFNIKIAEKKEFSDSKYDGTIYDIEKQAEILKDAPYELLPQQAFIRNFLSFQTPYNSLLLFHGLGSGKTCTAIGVCEEMREYSKQMGINKRIFIIASENVQDNFKLQLFDERKLKEENGVWSTKGCVGNKLLKEINPTGMTGLTKDKIIQMVSHLIKSSYVFYGYTEFSNKIVEAAGSETESLENKIRKLTRVYENSLIVIDEVHNIRIATDESKKNIGKQLMQLVKHVPNISLLLLSATPMFDNYKEIIWLLNLMNLNDRRGCISISDVFDSNGNWKKGKDGKKSGKDLLVRKATGYISYVRGENPYTFPFRVYPDRFAPKNTIKKYPNYQLNGMKIKEDEKIDKLCLFMTPIGEYQELGYNYIMDKLRNREERTKLTKKGQARKVPGIVGMKSFGYNELRLPIAALNIIYYHKDLEDLSENVKPIQFIEKYAENIDDKDDDDKSMHETEEFEEEDDDDLNDSDFKEDADKKLEKSADELLSESLSDDDDDDDESLSDDDDDDESLSDDDESLSDDDDNNKSKLEIKSLSPLSSSSSLSLSSKSTTSFKKSIASKSNNKDKEGLHIIEQNTKSNIPTKKNPVKESTLLVKKKGGAKEMDPVTLVSSNGLKRIMKFVEEPTKGEFEYQPNAPKIFQPDEIGKYSSKIKHICDCIYDRKKDKVADGIILIYSYYIDGGIIPMALALEEMGFTRYGEKASPLFKTPPTPIVDARTMKPPTSKTGFKPARYIMITGKSSLSPDSDGDVKAVTNDNNIFKEDENGNKADVSGEIIKVVLISQAGSEGLDFKAIRQVHILEPWFNMNRIEQIIGRSVRNFSHKDLPFTKRNVQIFMYGTALTNKEEEAADLYMYRKSEIKAIKIGKVTRLLKETAVDCIINHEQTNLTADEFKKSDIEENKNIVQILSDHQQLDHFEVGDVDDSVNCDFMECKFKCMLKVPARMKENINTYNSSFMLNTDNIIQKIKDLMSMRYFYKKTDLLKLVSIPKPYPTEQINMALTQMVDDNSEYIVDKYGRSGHLINIGEYYMFQPIELNYKNISVYDRSVPIDYKHKMLNMQVKPDIEDEEKVEVDKEDNEIFDTMFNNYKVALETSKIERGNNNWYHICGAVMRKIVAEDLIEANSDKEKRDILEEFLVHHIVDSLMMDEKVYLMNYLEQTKDKDGQKLLDEQKKRFYKIVYEYLLKKRIMAKGIIGMVIFNGISGVNNLNIFVLDKDTNMWTPAQPEDINDLTNTIQRKYEIHRDNVLNKYVGFIGFETNIKYMEFQFKEVTNKRSTGFSCDKAGKLKIVDIMNEIQKDKFKSVKESKNELCVRAELVLREFQRQKKDNKIWFLDTETAVINEFHKKEKNK